MYVAWIQVRLKKRWHSAIVADVEGQARNIRGMFTNMAKEYHLNYLRLELRYEGSSRTSVLERECVVGIGSAQEPDSLRSFDFSMLHESRGWVVEVNSNSDQRRPCSITGRNGS